MEQRGGCCTARYAGAGAYDMSKVDRMMMRFRPIAPKPASPTASFHGSASTTENSDPFVKSTGRKRRNTVAVNKRKRTSPSSEDSVSGGEITAVKTLSFLPEAPGVKESPKGVSEQRFPQWLGFGGSGHVSNGSGQVTVHEKPDVVGSWVKVERVIDTWAVDGCGWLYGAVGRSDEERVRGLDLDTCPGFVTDGLNRVRWMNAAYRRLVGDGVVDVAVEKGVVLPVGCAGFTCRVRVVTCGKEKVSQTVPCDVWRMDSGGFAWRLDTAAALCLGR